MQNKLVYILSYDRIFYILFQTSYVYIYIYIYIWRCIFELFFSNQQSKKFSYYLQICYSIDYKQHKLTCFFLSTSFMEKNYYINFLKKFSACVFNDRHSLLEKKMESNIENKFYL